MGLIPGQGTKAPQAAWHGQKQREYRFILSLVRASPTLVIIIVSIIILVEIIVIIG